jgi:hypothetical protein
MRGKGLLARILFSVPVNTVGYRTPGKARLDTTAVSIYTRNLCLLALTLAETSEPTQLHLSPQADNQVLNLEWEVEPKLAPNGTWGHLADWGSKWVGSIVRIAGLLHLADHVGDGWDRPIEAETIDRAAQIGRYFAAHAMAAFDDMGADPEVEAARHILGWAERTETERFTKRDLFSAMPRGRFKKASDLDAPLNLLTSHGYLLAEPQPERRGSGRKPSPIWMVHPDVIRPPAPVVPITHRRTS